MSWLERHQPDVYGRIQVASRSSGCPRRGDRPGLQPHDPAAGQRARHPDPDPLGPGRLPPPVRAGGAGHVAAGDGREPGGAGDPGRGRRRLHDPGAGPGGRHPAAGRAGQPIAWPPCRTRRGPRSTATTRSIPGSPTATCIPDRKGLGRRPRRVPRRAVPRPGLRGRDQRGAGRPGRRRPAAGGADWWPSASTGRPSATTTSGPTGRWPTPSPPRPPAGAWRSPIWPRGWSATRRCTRPRCTRAPGRAPMAWAAGRPTAAAPPAGPPAPTSSGGRRCGRRSTACAIPASRCSSGGGRGCSPAATPGRPETPTSTC